MVVKAGMRFPRGANALRQITKMNHARRNWSRAKEWGSNFVGASVSNEYTRRTNAALHWRKRTRWVW